MRRQRNTQSSKPAHVVYYKYICTDNFFFLLEILDARWDNFYVENDTFIAVSRVIQDILRAFIRVYTFRYMSSRAFMNFDRETTNQLVQPIP